MGLCLVDRKGEQVVALRPRSIIETEDITLHFPLLGLHLSLISFRIYSVATLTYKDPKKCSGQSVCLENSVLYFTDRFAEVVEMYIFLNESETPLILPKSQWFKKMPKNEICFFSFLNVPPSAVYCLGLTNSQLSELALGSGSLQEWKTGHKCGAFFWWSRFHGCFMLHCPLLLCLALLLQSVNLKQGGFGVGVLI